MRWLRLVGGWGDAAKAAICRDHFREIMGPTRSSVVPVVRRRGELDASVGAGMRIFRLALCGLAAAVMLHASVARADIRVEYLGV